MSMPSQSRVSVDSRISAGTGGILCGGGLVGLAEGQEAMAKLGVWCWKRQGLYVAPTADNFLHAIVLHRCELRRRGQRWWGGQLMWCLSSMHSAGCWVQILLERRHNAGVAVGGPCTELAWWLYTGKFLGGGATCVTLSYRAALRSPVQGSFGAGSGTEGTNSGAHLPSPGPSFWWHGFSLPSGGAIPPPLQLRGLRAGGVLGRVGIFLVGSRLDTPPGCGPRKPTEHL